MIKMSLAKFWFPILLALGPVTSQIGGTEVWGVEPAKGV